MPPERSRLWPLLLLPVLACCQKPAPAPAESPAQRDRRELTLQSRRNWAPEDAARKLSLKLIAQKTSILKGEGFRYRLELKNVGRESIAIREPAPSFIKEGVACEAHGWRFLVTPPGKSERALTCLPGTAQGAEGLELTLLPGDYLLTRRESAAEPFRELKTGFRFERPGPYRLRVVYSRPGLRAASNAVVMSVLP